MKKLNELFPDIASDSEVTGIKINSKEVEKAIFLFVQWE